jgi:archaellum component FlaC
MNTENDLSGISSHQLMIEMTKREISKMTDKNHLINLKTSIEDRYNKLEEEYKGISTTYEDVVKDFTELLSIIESKLIELEGK